MKSKILVVEDEAAINDLITISLEPQVMKFAGFMTAVRQSYL